MECENGVRKLDAACECKVGMFGKLNFKFDPSGVRSLTALGVIIY